MFRNCIGISFVGAKDIPFFLGDTTIFLLAVKLTVDGGFMHGVAMLTLYKPHRTAISRELEQAE